MAKSKATKTKATKTKAKAKNPLGLAPYDPADYLRTPKEVAMYLEAFFEDGVDHEALVHALGVVARARGGMSKTRHGNRHLAPGAV